ncbi:MAG: putative nicotinate-nucleotide adenylyltransferase [Syntrophorhabdus sp. PtaU1.Bin002]|nr:MAG: putative nicotinate-nucleotide adenylyltransferase [Syntrophorhabdus sp. PtaU1.Bin002]
MRVGIFGGTFDPIHVGHLRAAEEVRELFSLNRIYFVPACIPPHKRDQQISRINDRLMMAGLAVKGNRFFKVSDIEAKRDGISYSIDTITAIEGTFGDVYFLIGADAFSEIDTWHRYRDLFSHADFVVMVRPGHSGISGLAMFPPDVRESMKAVDERTFEHTSGKHTYLQPITQLDVSATKIRAHAGEGKSIKYLVPPAVETYIVKQGLYRRQKANHIGKNMESIQGKMWKS